eukprot:SAG31_NODE_15335_length_760_cov_0.627837_1_plen_67_part_10
MRIGVALLPQVASLLPLELGDLLLTPWIALLMPPVLAGEAAEPPRRPFVEVDVGGEGNARGRCRTVA